MNLFEACEKAREAKNGNNSGQNSSQVTEPVLGCDDLFGEWQKLYDANKKDKKRRDFKHRPHELLGKYLGSYYFAVVPSAMNPFAKGFCG
jgi:hypothetical protein